MNSSQAHSSFMQRCLELAQLGRGSVSPNPMVGCVIVHEEKIIAEGYHSELGGPHAEVNAIRACKNPELLSTSTLYVSLEPCSHHGKTPPCANLILEKGIPQVVVAMMDPNPLVSGQGINLLQEAGVSVEIGLLEKEARELNKIFVWAQTNKSPYIFIKWAESKDGYVDRNRTSSNEKAAKISDLQTDVLSHELRAKVDAVLVGRRTFELDLPALNVRLVEGKHPLRILLDPTLRIDESLIQINESNTLIINSFKNLKDSYISYLKVENWAHPSELLELLHRAGVHSILIEGGPKTIQWFLDSGQWNELRRIHSNSIELKEGIAAPKIPLEARLLTRFNSGLDVVEDYFLNPKPSGDPN